MKHHNRHRRRGFIWLPMTLIATSLVVSLLIWMMDTNYSLLHKMNTLHYLTELSASYHESPIETLKTLKKTLSVEIKQSSPYRDSTINVQSLCVKNINKSSDCIPIVKVIRPYNMIKNIENQITELREPLLKKVWSSCQNHNTENP